MKLVRAFSMALLATFALTACDEDSTGVEIADLAGFWTATEFSYNDQTGNYPGFGLDAVSPTVGGTVTLDVAESGTFTGSLRIPGLTVNPQTGETVTVPIGGTISLIDDETFSIDFTDETEALGFFGDIAEADFTLTDNTLTFVYEDTTFDFPDSVELQVIGVARGSVTVDLVAEFTRN
jgi:hypothetical protein